MYLGRFAKRRARLEEQVGADHGRMLGSVPPEDIGQNVVADFPVEVEIDIGQVGSARVQESLQGQSKAQGIHIGNLQEVTNQGIAGRTAEGHAMTLAPGITGDIADDKEVTSQVARLDNSQF